MKLDILRKRLEKEDRFPFLVLDLVNIRYLTGFMVLRPSSCWMATGTTSSPIRVTKSTRARSYPRGWNSSSCEVRPSR